MSDRSIRDLERLTADVRSRREECLAVLLEGIQMYLSLGREVELLEFMREYERDVRPAVEGTPSAADLEQLYNREEEDSTPSTE